MTLLPSTRRAWLVTGLLFVFIVINFADKALLGLASKPLSAAFGLDAAGYGLVASSFFLLFSVSGIAVGFLANRFPTRWLLLALVIVWSISLAPMTWTTSIAVLVASRVTLGAAEGPAYGLANHSMFKWFPENKRQLPSSVLLMGSSVGTLLAAPGLTWVIQNVGWRTAFGVTSLLGVLWCIVWMTLVREEGPYGASAEPSPSDEPVLTTAVQHVAYRRIFCSGTFIGSVLLGFAAYFGVAIAVAWVPQFLQDGHGLSATAAGNVVAAFWAVSGALILGTGLLSQRLTLRGVSTTWSRGMLSVAMVLAGGILTLLGALVSSPTLSVVLLLAGIAAPGGVVAIIVTLCEEISPVQQRGAVLGTTVALSTLAGVIAPTLMGRLVESASEELAGYTTGFAVLAIICVVAAVAGAALIRPTRDAVLLRRPRETATAPDHYTQRPT
ncbi:MFS transporter [Nocardia sp. SYP-A9097]|uniref:MFS transporter n=1 Tax=Nocardia sp. SYP-A9097 TaxID=2663237 RepID=UPI002814DA1E|nr:MFS transporter [Nocardia sp. SYP-A9097]